MKHSPFFIIGQAVIVPSRVGASYPHVTIKTDGFSHLHIEVVSEIGMDSSEVLDSGLVLNLRKDFSWLVSARDSQLFAAFLFSFDKDLDDSFDVVEIEPRGR